MLPILLMLLTSGAPFTAPIDRPLPIGQQDSEVFQYDDGTASWLTWGGLWRGNWFSMDDFGAAGNSLVCSSSEFWFFHHACYCWDTDFFFAEVWSGESGWPSTLISQESVTAMHYTAVYCPYEPAIDVGNSFWILQNTEMSCGGWPPILGDGTPQAVVSHSYFSDDFELWEPWVITGAFANDYMIRAHGSLLWLAPMSWAQVKASF